MNIVILGSGNAATHFGQVFQQIGHQIVQVYSKTKANADALAFALQCPSTNHLGQVVQDADLYLIAVSDQSIASVVERMPKDIRGIVTHCSGATDMSILGRFKHYGVIYPPQSLSKSKSIDFSSIPFCVEGDTESTSDTLLRLAQTFSAKSIPCNSQQRLAIHLSSVLVNNFPNILYQIAYELLEEHNLSFDLVRPIIRETAEKVQNNVPITVQTGPAIRGDETTQQKHLKFISNRPDLQQIYQLLSHQIIKRK